MIKLMNQFFLLQRGEFCIYLYDYLNEYLKRPIQQIDFVKSQSLFQQCLINVFPTPSPTTQRFIDSLSLEKRGSLSSGTGWEGVDVVMHLDYPINIIITNSILLKYKRMFSQLILYNVFSHHALIISACVEVWIWLGR